MFRIKHNIIFSVMAHTILLAAVLLIGGRSELRKASLLNVSLFSEKESRFPAQQAVDTGRKQNAPAVAVSKKVPEKKEMGLSAPQEAIPIQNTAPLMHLKPRSDMGSESVSEAAGTEKLNNPSPIGGRSVSSVSSQTSRSSGGDADSVSASRGHTGKESGGSADGSLRRRIRDALQANLIYPYIAKKRSLEGTVLMEFRINSRGIPEGIRIIKGSSYSILDEAARETVIKTSPFPAISTVIEVPIRFSLRGQPGL